MVGGAIIPNTICPDNQTRASARSGYYDGFIDSRPNFHLATGQHVTRLLLSQSDGDRDSDILIDGLEVKFAR